MLDDVETVCLDGRRERIQRTTFDSVRIARCKRNDRAHVTATSKRPCYCERERPLALYDTAQQRAPRQGDPQLVNTPMQCTHSLSRICDDESRVWHAVFARRTARRLYKRAGVRVDADDERARL
jgi:hypothetical protein